VQPVRCLANCTRGPSAAIRCSRSWTYVFGGSMWPARCTRQGRAAA
jgi:predicted metal-binding protein